MTQEELNALKHFTTTKQWVQYSGILKGVFCHFLNFTGYWKYSMFRS